MTAAAMLAWASGTLVGVLLGMVLGARLALRMLARRLHALRALEGGVALPGTQIAEKIGVGVLGSVYPLLSDLEGRGFVHAEPEAASLEQAVAALRRGGRPRRLYTITERGRALLAAFPRSK